MVELAKRALETVTNDRPMNEEVLRMFLIEVESMLTIRHLVTATTAMICEC